MAGLAAATVIIVPATVAAVDTDMAIGTTVIDFGEVDVGSSAATPVALSNTGGDPFGQVNMFGGAPPTSEFNASQNCQGTTLAPGGTCTISYTFSPGSAGSFNATYPAVRRSRRARTLTASSTSSSTSRVVRIHQTLWHHHRIAQR